MGTSPVMRSSPLHTYSPANAPINETEQNASKETQNDLGIDLAEVRRADEEEPRQQAPLTPGMISAIDGILDAEEVCSEESISSSPLLPHAHPDALKGSLPAQQLAFPKQNAGQPVR